MTVSALPEPARRAGYEFEDAELPAEIVKRAEAKISSITSGGKPLR